MYKRVCLETVAMCNNRVFATMMDIWQCCNIWCWAVTLLCSERTVQWLIHRCSHTNCELCHYWLVLENIHKKAKFCMIMVIYQIRFECDNACDVILQNIYIKPLWAINKQIHHMGDTESPDVCGQKHKKNITNRKCHVSQVTVTCYRLHAFYVSPQPQILPLLTPPICTGSWFIIT